MASFISQEHKHRNNILKDQSNGAVSREFSKLTGFELDTNQADNKDSHEQPSHRRVLIVAAVCFSIVGISLTYKISEDKKISLENSVSITSNNSDDQIKSDQRVIDALNKAKIDALGALATSSNPFLPSPKDNVSDRFTKDIISAYAEYDQTDQAPDAESIVNNMDYLDTSDIEKNKYSLAYLPIFVPTTKDQIKEYGNEFARIYLTDLAPVNNDTTGKYQTDLSLMVPIYRKIGEDLMKIKTPASVSAAHLSLANDYLKQSDAFTLIDKEDSDPVQALLGLKVVSEAVPRQAGNYAQITNYLDTNGIIYGAGEPGNFWSVGTTTVSLPQSDQSDQ